MAGMAVSVLEEKKYIPFGGPDGGDGGDGGSIIIEARDGLNTLADFRNKSKFIAQNGKSGSGKNKKGKSGNDLVIKTTSWKYSL